jgi:hypothetical protein
MQSAELRRADLARLFGSETRQLKSDRQNNTLNCTRQSDPRQGERNAIGAIEQYPLNLVSGFGRVRIGVSAVGRAKTGQGKGV